MPSQKKLAAIMFTDIVGYTRLMGQDEYRAMDLVRKNRDIHKRLAKEHGGKWLKEIGDGNLLSFDSISAAVSCAGAIISASRDVDGLDLRIGIHQGEIVVEGEDIYGDGVNIASRIENQAKANTVLVSDTVNRNIRNKGFTTQFIEEVELKNVEDPIKVYQVTGYPESKIEETKKKSGNLIYSAIAVIILITAAGFWYFSSETKEDKALVQASAEESELTQADRIAVLPFDDRTGDDNYSSLGKMLSDWTTSLIYETGREIVSPKTVEQNIQFAGILPGKDTDRPAFSEVTGATKIIEGEYYLIDGKLRIIARLISAKTGHIIYQFEGLEDKAENASKLVENASQQIAGYLAAERSVNLGLFTPPNYEAYKAYQEATNARSRQEVIEGISRAMQLDSGFVFPYRYLGILFDGDVEKARAALRRHKPQITQYEELIFDFYSAESGYERMLITQKVYEMDPQDKEVQIVHGTSLLRQNYPGKALRLFESYEVDPQRFDAEDQWGSAPLWLNLSGLFQQGEYLKCLSMIHKIPIEKRDEDLHGFAIRAMVRADYPTSSIYSYIDSVDQFGSMEFTDELYGTLLQAAGIEATTFNRQDLSKQVLRDLLDNWPQELSPGAKPYTMLIVGDYAGAEEIYAEILAKRDSLDSSGPTQYYFFTVRMGITKALLGKKEEALEALKILGAARDNIDKDETLSALQKIGRFGTYSYGMAAIYANLGEQDKAMELLIEAFETGSISFMTAPDAYSYAWDPMLVNMQDYEPFIEFCKPKDLELEIN